MNIGKRLRELRKNKKITLGELSKVSGVAIATLSRMETGKMPGTITAHENICKALGVALSSLYDKTTEDEKIIEVINGIKTEHFKKAKGVKSEVLVTKPYEKSILPILLKINPKSSTLEEKDSIGTEKYAYIFEGKLEAKIGGKIYKLKKGDSIYFDASLPHSFTNQGKVTSSSLVVVVPKRL